MLKKSPKRELTPDSGKNGYPRMFDKKTYDDNMDSIDWGWRKKRTKIKVNYPNRREPEPMCGFGVINNQRCIECQCKNGETNE